MGIIYKMNIWQKIECTIVSMQNLKFINMDVNGD